MFIHPPSTTRHPSWGLRAQNPSCFIGYFVYTIVFNVFIIYFHFYIAPSRCYQGPDPDRFHQSLKKADKGLSSTTLNDGTLPRDRHSSHSIFIIVIITKTDQDQSFADVPISDAGVDTVQFLLASEGLVGLFGKYLLLSLPSTRSDFTPPSQIYLEVPHSPLSRTI